MSWGTSSIWGKTRVDNLGGEGLYIATTLNIWKKSHLERRNFTGVAVLFTREEDGRN